MVFEADERTPDQRFWIAKVMNVAYQASCPDINEEDPNPENDDYGSNRWLKVWWCEAKKEYGKYPHGYHFVGGIRRRSMSWAADSDVICKLVGGLNKDNTIKRFKNYRKKLECDIKARLGQVGQDEDLDDENDEEDDHSQ